MPTTKIEHSRSSNTQNQSMTVKEKILLSEAQETLLIPLYSKAVESRRPDPILVDDKAQEILASVEYDFTRLNIPRKTEVMVCMRAKKMDDITREFLSGHPKSVVLHLGCGLDSRYLRVDPREAEWYDLDMPEAIELRRKFYRETDTYHMIPSSVTDLNWIELIAPRDRPVLVVAEGLFMYLKENDVKALVLILKDTFPECELSFDAFSVLTARSAGQHPSLRKTGAAIHWGIDDAREIERWADGIRLREEWFFSQSEDLGKLETGFRLAFKVAGFFPAAKKAHRILYFSLS
jgi:O-methyltransferase involved in polyketide biosynthesis